MPDMQEEGLRARLLPYIELNSITDCIVQESALLTHELHAIFLERLFCYQVIDFLPIHMDEEEKDKQRKEAAVMRSVHSQVGFFWPRDSMMACCLSH